MRARVCLAWQRRVWQRLGRQGLARQRAPRQHWRRAAPGILLALTALATTGAGWPVQPGSRMPAGLTATGVRLHPADVLIVASGPLPASTVAAVGGVRGVQAAEAVDAARIRVNGKLTAVLGVDPASFRAFAAGPTARSSRVWQSVAAGGVAVSWTMGRQDRLRPGGQVALTGRSTLKLPVGGFGTVGIAGVDAVLSHAVARSLGFPLGNAIVISAPHTALTPLLARLRAVLPARAVVEPLVSPAAAPGAAGAPGAGAAGLTRAQAVAVLRAAESRLGMPYVWGAAGPASFDCSGLVQWSFARAGIAMPRVAADQARTGPAVPLSQAQPGDLIFYRTDPTAPGYISHVAIYLGAGWMIQAPEPGMNVEIVRVAQGSEFAGVVAVSPRLAAAAAASPVG